MELVNRKVFLSKEFGGNVDLNNPVLRFCGNPILTPHSVNSVWDDPALQVITVHNAGIAMYKDCAVMLFRSHLRCGMSVLGLARSVDGVSQWEIVPRPVIIPATKNDHFAPGVDVDSQIEMESGGVEDPRITQLGNEYVITYSAYHGKTRNRVRVCLATTTNFEDFVRWGPMLDQDMRNVVVFSRPFSEGYAALFRPNDVTSGDVGGIYTQIRIGFTDDWRRGPWKILDEPIMKTGGGPNSFSDKIGPGAPPIETSEGWLSIFHGVRTTMDGNPYVLGVALHDYDNWSVINMSSIPILFPSDADCRVPDDAYIHVPQVVFTCGALRHKDGTIAIYYGGNDTVMNCALTHEDVLVTLCKKYGRDSRNGDLRYQL
jgi:predicted GH43/DUF377 family glycosyl hydrolase